MAQQHVDALADGRRPTGMTPDLEVAYDFIDELLKSHGVCDATFERATQILGESGVVDLIGVVGYFTTVSMVLNVAHTPAESDAVSLLAVFPR